MLLTAYSQLVFAHLEEVTEVVNTAATKSLEFTLPSVYTAQQIVHERIVAQISPLNPSSRVIFCIRLALEEALTNAMKHGNQMDPTKKVFVKSTIEESTITIEVRDEGKGFTPDDVPDPTASENLGRASGRGVLLIQSFMDSAEYNDKGNLLTMSKSLAPQA